MRFIEVRRNISAADTIPEDQLSGGFRCMETIEIWPAFQIPMQMAVKAVSRQHIKFDAPLPTHKVRGVPLGVPRISKSYFFYETYPKKYPADFGSSLFFYLLI